MDIKDLKYFIAVAREGNITKAAESLFISQPTLSYSLQQLEERLGVQLLNRSNRNTTLTEKGKIFYQHALEIVELIEKREREIKEKDTVSGEIVIGSGVVESFDILSDIMIAFKKEYPLITFNLITGARDQVIEKMDMGIIDIGLVLGFVSNDRYSSLKLDKQEEFVCLTRKDSILYEKDTVTPKDLIGTNLTIPQSNSNKMLFDWLGKSKEQLDIFVTHDLLDNASLLVEKGLCSAITLEANAKNHLNDKIGYKYLKPKLVCESFIIWNKHKSHTEAVMKFINFIENYIEKQ